MLAHFNIRFTSPAELYVSFSINFKFFQLEFYNNFEFTFYTYKVCCQAIYSTY